MLLASYDDSPRIYRIDPAGYYKGVRAVSIGVKNSMATTFLEKKLKKTESELSEKETIEITLECLQQALGIDLKSNEVEVIVATRKLVPPYAEFTRLSDEQIDTHLNAIAERD